MSEGIQNADSESGAHDTFWTVGLGAGVGQMIALAVDADDEHGTAVAIALRLIAIEIGRSATLRGGVADALAEAAVAKLVGAAEEFDGEVGAVGGEGGFHGAVMLVTKGKDVSPHCEECSIQEVDTDAAIIPRVRCSFSTQPNNKKVGF